MSYAGLGQVFPGGRGNSNDGSPTRGNSNDGSPTRTEVRSPTSTSTSTEVRSPTSTSTDAYTRGNITVTGGAGEGAYTNVRVYQGLPADYRERAGRAAGRTQERIVRDSRRGLMAPRPAGTPIPLQSSTTQKVGLVGIGGYTGLGQAAEAPITSGALAQTDPIMSKASLMAANVMKNMATVSKPARAAWLQRNINGLWPRMGDEVLVSIARISASGKSRDQAIYDAVRLALANRLMERAAQVAAKRGGLSGLGDTTTDARAVACTAASFVAMGGGVVGAFVPGADTHIIGGANAGASISNCNLPTLLAQAQIAQAEAAAAAAAGAAGTNRTVMYAGLGLGAVVVLAIAYKLVK